MKKKKIIEMINKIENEKLIATLYNVVKMAYKQYLSGKWGA